MFLCWEGEMLFWHHADGALDGIIGSLSSKGEWGKVIVGEGEREGHFAMARCPHCHPRCNQEYHHLLMWGVNSRFVARIP